MNAERRSYLVCLPLTATLIFYGLPHSLQASVLVQFLPQITGYLAFGLWLHDNTHSLSLLGLSRHHLRAGLPWGLGIGFCLGLFNSLIILYALPHLGIDILFLQHTPHAQMPTFIMLPWVIVSIALFVEINFRGFQLGRLLALFSQIPALQAAAPILAILVSAFQFCFDPFMVTTFQHLHWIALWDGVVWATLWVYRRNLYVTIIAHACEVVIMYSLLKVTLT